jgi:hypothetical protein
MKPQTLYFIAASLIAFAAPGCTSPVSPMSTEDQSAQVASVPKVTTQTPKVTTRTAAQTTAPAQSSTRITISVPSGARQTFGGLGTSIGNWGGTYQQLPLAQRAALSRMLWKDTRFKILRLWFNTDDYAPTPGARNMAPFRKMYLDSGVIADARKNGVTTLLLGPEHLPEYMKGPRQQDGTWNLKDSEVQNYALLLADFIAQLKKESGITVDVSGIQNEPNVNEIFSPLQINDIIKRLRTELDRRGLRSVKLIAAEHASPDFKLFEQLDAFKKDPIVWQNIVGISSHSYNMAANDQAANYIAGGNGQNLKEYWMSEASDNGAEQPNDIRRAVSLSARFLNDMNHRVTHWVHFLGYEVSDPKDDATRIIAYTVNPAKITVFKKYYTYQQLAAAFDVGAIFRDSQSSLDGDMTWTFGLKPHLISATAKNPDGSWSIGLANYTADTFLGVQGWGDDKWNTEQGGQTPAQDYPVTIRVDELKSRATVSFVVYRTNSTVQNAKSETVTMKNGAVTVNVKSQELVTLRSAAAR